MQKTQHPGNFPLSSAVQQAFRFQKLCPLLIQFLLFSFAALAIYLRAPDLFSQPRLWAEEGVIYFADAYHSVWYVVLTNLRTNYLNLWPALSAVIAANFVPLEEAPVVTTFFAYTAQLLPVLVIVLSSSVMWQSPIRKALGVLIVVFAPSSHEVWLNTINSQFYFQLTTFLILLDQVPERAAKKWFYRINLLVGGLTGMISLFLFPVFVYLWGIEKEKERKIQSFLLGTCLLIQSSAFIYQLIQVGENATRRFAFTVGIRTSISILWSRCVALVLIGSDLATKATDYLYPLTQNSLLYRTSPIVLLLIEIAFFGWLVHKLSWKEKVVWLGGFFATFIPSILFAVGSQPKFFLIYPLHSPRYFIVPSIILILLFLRNMSISRTHFQKVAFTSLLVISLFWGMVSFVKQNPFLPGQPIWSNEVAQWRADPLYSINIWPSGWKVTLENQDH